MAKAKILQVIAGLDCKSGGPSRTVVQLSDALARQANVHVTLLSQGIVGVQTVQSSEPQVDRRVMSSGRGLSFTLGLPAYRELVRLVGGRSVNLIHCNGLWMPVNHWAAHVARRFDMPLIIQPRGMLEPWALNHKAWKKKIAMMAFQRRDFETAQALVATSAVEYENIRKLGLQHPIAVIPNGVDLAGVRVTNSEKSSISGTRTVLFLSRIYPVKGLLNLVHAWSRVRPEGWRLVIAGPNEDNHLNEVMALVHQQNIDASVRYVGEVDDAEKSALYNCADLFVLPTFSENFGVVIAEALAHGVPVITTKGAPWADLEKYDCGWWIEIGVEPLMQALRAAIALSDEERRAMGSRGREYVRRYNWDGIAKQMTDVYRWVLQQGDRPDCVRID